jgi:NhaP-type Na+/H+ or K+/H+ antiporter
MSSQLRYLIVFICVTAFGIILGSVLGIDPINQPAFPMFASAALVIGLYGSVVGIDLVAIKPHWKRAILIITLAVPIKIIATGILTYLIFPINITWLVAVAISQIDPLSVETLINNKKRMSETAKSLLRVWASFDDPVTVIFGFLVLLPLVAGTNLGLDFSTYMIGLAANLLPAVLVFFLMRFLKRYKTDYSVSEHVSSQDLNPALRKVNNRQRIIYYTIIAVALVYAFATGSYLFAAITGLLVRIPEQDHKLLSSVISVLYSIVVLIVGMSLYTSGIDIAFGLVLAFVAFFIVQPSSAILFFKGRRLDVLRIAFAQQNGLTTLLIGLAFQAVGFDVLPILIPAIVCINLMNLLVNMGISWLEDDNRLPWLMADQVSLPSKALETNISSIKD